MPKNTHARLKGIKNRKQIKEQTKEVNRGYHGQLKMVELTM